jgi:hypothetical protein
MWNVKTMKKKPIPSVKVNKVEAKGKEQKISVVNFLENFYPRPKGIGNENIPNSLCIQNASFK